MVSTHKSKTKAELVHLLDVMMQHYGDQFRTAMCPVDQANGLTLFTAALPVSLLHAAICRLPRSLENPEGIQRAFVPRKVNQIKDIFQASLEERSDKGADFPGAVVITLKTSSPLVAISPPAVQGDAAKLQIELRAFRDHIRALDTDADGYLLKPEKDMLGFMIDGHHRTEGAYEAGCLSFQFPTTIYADLNLKKMAGSFAGINCYQEKPSAIHTNAIRNLSGLMTNTENDAFLLMTTLNDGDTILHERIKMYDGPRDKRLPRTFINSSKLQKLLENWLEDIQQIGFTYRNINEKLSALDTYFRAWKQCYPDAWDNTNYVLTKTMGMDILFALYPKLCTLLRTDILAPGQPLDLDAFVTAIHRCFFRTEGMTYAPKEITLDPIENICVPLDWSSASFGSLSNGKGINQLKKILLREIGNSYGLSTQAHSESAG